MLCLCGVKGILQSSHFLIAVSDLLLQRFLACTRSGKLLSELLHLVSAAAQLLLQLLQL